MVTETSPVGLFSGLKGHHKSAQRQSEAASAAKRRPGSACVEIVSPVKGDTNGINRDCEALNRANLINPGHPGRRLAAVAASLCPGLICPALNRAEYPSRVSRTTSFPRNRFETFNPLHLI